MAQSEASVSFPRLAVTSLLVHHPEDVIGRNCEGWPGLRMAHKLQHADTLTHQSFLFNAFVFNVSSAHKVQESSPAKQGVLCWLTTLAGGTGLLQRRESVQTQPNNSQYSSAERCSDQLQHASLPPQHRCWWATRGRGEGGHIHDSCLSSLRVAVTQASAETSLPLHCPNSPGAEGP